MACTFLPVLCSRARPSTSQRRGILHPTSRSRFGFEAHRCNSASEETRQRVTCHHSLRNSPQRNGAARHYGDQRDWAAGAADPTGAPGAKGWLCHRRGARAWKTGQKALAASSDTQARVIQTGPSAGEIIPKEGGTQSVFKALQPIFAPQNATHVSTRRGCHSVQGAKEASGGAGRAGIAFVSATAWWRKCRGKSCKMNSDNEADYTCPTTQPGVAVEPLHKRCSLQGPRLLSRPYRCY